MVWVGGVWLCVCVCVFRLTRTMGAQHLADKVVEEAETVNVLVFHFVQVDARGLDLLADSFLVLWVLRQKVYCPHGTASSSVMA